MKETEELTIEQLTLIQKISLFTGSRRFLVNKGNSDWDYVCLKSVLKKNLPGVFNKLDFYYDQDQYEGAPDVFDSFRFNCHEMKINLIVVYDELTLAGWKYATECFLRTPIEHFKNDEQRKLYFELLKLSYIAIHQKEGDVKLFPPRIIKSLFG